MAGCFLEMCFRGVDHRVGVMKMYLSLEISCRDEDDAVQKFCFCIEKSISQCGGSCRVKKFDFPSFSHIITVRISLTFFSMRTLAFISVLFGTVFLASCGKSSPESVSTGATENPQMVSTASDSESTNVCEVYLEYLSCTYSKSGFDEEMIKTQIDGARSGFDILSPSERQKACQDLVDYEKQQALVEGCNL